MKRKQLIIAFVSIISLYFLGDWLAGIYGFDPPYALYFIGVAFIYISSLTAIVLALYIISKIIHYFFKQKK